ncbi:coiled-coil domain-containing protein 33 isoform X2 [Denticeps clupeoides]|uniref:Uncharacterized protein n=1 Tax=Denticeps clupeoides TaxID=299321 RepID=A0AAY4DCI1_9TELE|nr:coiled-coil domain-containing protein 33 isoform X2 [Denticeps clupeoides]
MLQHYRPHKRALQRETFGLPSFDALAQILPEYQHFFKTGGTQNKLPSAPAPAEDAGTREVIEHQTKELENYRTAMTKMADDIIDLRTQMVALESENSQLCSELSQHQDLRRTLLDETDIDVMTKTEIVDRIVALKDKLASETTKTVTQKDKIHQLQNELIRKMDGEKELLQLTQAHQQLQAELQSHLGRMASLEVTLLQQEKVIEKMEKVLNMNLMDRNKHYGDRRKMNKKHKDKVDGVKREIESALAVENSRLREELERMRQQPPQVIVQPSIQAPESYPVKEKLHILAQLQRAESRIRMLEAQLEENSRCWGKEKQSMLTRLSEHDYGFAQTSTMILHDLPQKDIQI